MIFKTESGSTYEVDTVGLRARSIKAANGDASVRLTPEWRPLLGFSVELGKSAWLYWTQETPLLPSSVLPDGFLPIPATVTSPVTSITWAEGESPPTP